MREIEGRRLISSSDLLHGQGHRTIDHAMDQETVLARVDVGKATALDHEVKRRRRDDPQRLVQGREVPAQLVQSPGGLSLTLCSKRERSP
jgi:hypothetical protein